MFSKCSASFDEPSMLLFISTTTKHLAGREVRISNWIPKHTSEDGKRKKTRTLKKGDMEGGKGELVKLEREYESRGGTSRRELKEKQKAEVSQ